MSILGIDPGKTTGLSVVAATETRSGVPMYTLLEMRQVEAVKGNLHDVYLALLFLLNKWTPSVVVVEDYIGGQGGTVQTITARVIGAVEFVCMERRITLDKSPNFARTTGQEEALRLVGRGHDVRHARDACAHAVAHQERVCRDRAK